MDFSPLNGKEAVGVFYRITDTQEFKSEVRTGLGAKQVKANGVYYVDANASNENTVVVKELGDSEVLGWELVGEASGLIEDANLRYSVYAEALMPISYSPSSDERSNTELISTELKAQLGYIFTDWFALNYELSARKDPLVKEEAQISHNLLLTANFLGEI